MSSRISIAVAMVGLVAVIATGCGSDTGDTASTAPTTAATSAATESSPTPTEASLPPGTPDCAEVWQDGATLPRPYDGCADEAGALVESDPLACSSGQSIIRYDDRFYAVAGGTVHGVDAPLDQDSEYRAAALRCRA